MNPLQAPWCDHAFPASWSVLLGLGLWLATGAAAVALAGAADSSRTSSRARDTARMEAEAEAAQRRDDLGEVVRSRLALGELHLEGGHFCAATEQLEKVLPLADATGNPEWAMRARLALGVLNLRARRLPQAGTWLEAALGFARGLTNRAVEAEIRASQGFLALSDRSATPTMGLISGRAFELDEELPASSGTDEAREYFEDSMGLAEGVADLGLRAGILLQAARGLLLMGATERSRDAVENALGLLAEEDSGAAPMLLASCGRALGDLAYSFDPPHEGLLAQSTAACRRARRAAGSRDSRVGSYAAGYLGALALRERNLPLAMELTLEALEAAGKSENDEARFEWTWQAARVLWAQTNLIAASDTYTQAVDLLRSSRSERRWGPLRGIRGSPFPGESLAELYYERADLLLRLAREMPQGERRQSMLSEVRRTIEFLRVDELDDYYLEEECAGLVQTKVDSLDRVSAGVAVLYLFPLADRTEVLVRWPTGLEPERVQVPGATIRAVARSLRAHLSTGARKEEREEARQLWDWLIQPIYARLERERIHTLVFVPDGELAQVPPGAFRGPDGFLIERFAVAVSPGLSLMKAEPLRRHRLQPLLCGISQSWSNFPALTAVAQELSGIRSNSHGGKQLLNPEFTTSAFARELRGGRYSVVHIASHGVFGGDASRTFVLADQGQRITMDFLEECVLPRMLSPRPIELLVLSACETAAGDDRAAFGLAGIAVKSGARTAVASLWRVNDPSTRDLMIAFYQGLRDEPAASRAQVLQRAQRQMILSENYRDPYYWSPFILVGQWEDAPASPPRAPSRIRPRRTPLAFQEGSNPGGGAPH